jgi:hypothetical protein
MHREEVKDKTQEEEREEEDKSENMIMFDRGTGESACSSPGVFLI